MHPVCTAEGGNHDFLLLDTSPHFSRQSEKRQGKESVICRHAPQVTTTWFSIFSTSNALAWSSLAAFSLGTLYGPIRRIRYAPYSTAYTLSVRLLAYVLCILLYIVYQRSYRASSKV